MQVRPNGSSRRRRLGTGLVVVLFAGVAAGCTGSPSTHPSSSPSPTQPRPFPSISLNGPATPIAGGTLRVLSSSDTDYLDPNISYYSLGYAFVRQFSRQLYTWPAEPGHTSAVVPDLAISNPKVDPTRTVYTVTIRRGTMWNTSPPRQVTAADVIRGVETTCNPYQPFGGLHDFEDLIAGMQQYCQRFAAVHPRVQDIRWFLNQNHLSGVRVGSSRRQVVFQLNHPANDFIDILALPAFSPRPRELLRYLPGSPAEAQHTISDGPYVVAHYKPSHRLVFERNRHWQAETDEVRKAYVDRIVIDLTAVDPAAAVRTLRRGRGRADLCWCGVETALAKKLLARDDPSVHVDPQIANNPYFLFNTASPNNHGALQDPLVRRAISYALDRDRLLRVIGGTTIAEPLSHVLPSGVLGSEPFDPYPYEPDKARQLLAQADAEHLNLKLLYRPASPTAVELTQELERELRRVGIKVVPYVNESDYYTKGLSSPTAARRGFWDIAIAGWQPDWVGNAAADFFHPLFDGRNLPPSSYDFGLYNSPDVSAAIDRAEAAPLSQAASLWHQVDESVMADAPFYPIAQPNEVSYVPPWVRGFVFLPVLGGPDLTNVWLEPKAR